MIKVSVIVPVYNVEKYLGECLDSLIGQTLQDIEIIAVNDGSTDDSLQILNEYAAKDGRIKVYSQQNSGQSAARNRGLSVAAGEYVAFIDADDWVDRDFLEKLYQAAQRENADIAAGTIISCGENGKSNHRSVSKSYQCLKTLKEKWNILLDNGAHCYICNKIYRREPLIDKKVMFVEGHFYEDILWSPLAIKVLGCAVVIPHVSYYYRYNPTSTTRSVECDDKIAEDYKEARKALVRFAGYYKLDVSFDALKRCAFKILGLPLVKIEYGDTGFKFYFLGICFLQKSIRERL